MKKFKLSVAIPAHNEEKNIGKLLSELVHQNRENFEFAEIIVACDGCTDKTAEIVKSYTKKYKFIKLINDGQRIGKIGRLKTMFKAHTGDSVVCLDADTKLGSKYVLSEIARSFIKDPDLGLVGGNDQPEKPRNFFELIVIAWFKHWVRLNRSVNNYVNPQNSHGCLLALSQKLSKKLDLPVSVAADDLYIFFKTMELGFKFSYCPGAVVLIKVPSNFSDFIKQSVRFGQSGADVYKMFPNLDTSKFEVGTLRKIKAYLTSFAIDPILFPLALALQVLVRIKAQTGEKTYSGGVFETVKSSK